MRLLFLTPGMPYPPHQGTAMRNWGLISNLAQRHDLALLTFAHPGEAVGDELRSVCSRVESAPAPTRSRLARLRTLGLTRTPDLARRLHSPHFAARLRQQLAETQFDIVQVEGLEMGAYVDIIRDRAPQTRLVYDAHNAETLIQRRAFETDIRRPPRWPHALYSRMQLPRLRRFERAVCSATDAVLCVSAADARALQAIAPHVQPVLIPNGISLRDYRQPAAPSPRPTTTLVFTGKMDYRPNVDAACWFASEILPRIQEHHPHATFCVVGKNPATAMQELSSRGSVTVTGAVADVRPYIAGAAVFVVPVRMGGGTRFKILEALALERPVVATSVGAEGFDVQSGRELVVADSAEAFAQAVSALLDDPASGCALGQAGRRYVEANFDWEQIVPRLEAVYKHLLHHG